VDTQTGTKSNSGLWGIGWFMKCATARCWWWLWPWGDETAKLLTSRPSAGTVPWIEGATNQHPVAGFLNLSHWSRKALAKISHDGRRLFEPAGLAVTVGDFQAGHLGAAAALLQFTAVGAVVLRIAQLDRQGQAVHFLPHLDAKRASAELVKHQALALQVNDALSSRCALNSGVPREALFEQHDGAENDAQGSKKGTDQGFHKGLNNSKVDEK
jgi:hypothetical protein